MGFDFDKAQPLATAVQDIGKKTPVGAALSSAQWADVPQQLRETAMFSAQVESVRAMQEVKDSLTSLLSGERDDKGALKMDRSKFIKTIQETAGKLGLRTQDQTKKGSIQDFGSERRLKLIYEQQIGAAQSLAYWQQGQDPDVLNAWPAQELVRVADRKKKRDWKRRWLAAAQQVNYEGVSQTAMAAGHMIALKTSPIWVALSRFWRPYPPFDYNSGMGVREIDREGAIEWGLLQPGQLLHPDVAQHQQALRASAAGLDPQMRAALLQKFGNQLTINGDDVVWKGLPDNQTTGQGDNQVPFATLDEARAFFTGRGVHQVLDQAPGFPEYFGRPMSDADQLALLSVLGQESRRLEQSFPGIDWTKLHTLLAVDSETGAADLDGPTATLAAKTREWSSEEWTPIEEWERDTGRRASTERRGSQVRDNFRHELGHTFATPAVLAEWEQIWQSYGADWFCEHVSNYAGSLPAEGLAETFGLLTREDYVRGSLPADIERLVFETILGESGS
jgi:hypothetical protein